MLSDRVFLYNTGPAFGSEREKMASRRAGLAAAALAERFVAASRRGRSSGLEATRRAFSSSSWQLAQADHSQPGLLASASPWTHHRQSQEPFSPWALQGVMKQPLLFSSEQEKDSSRDDDDGREDFEMNVAEARKILVHVNAVALKKRIKADPRDSFSYRDLLDLIKESSVGANDEEAMRYARALDDAGVILIFRENVYLHPERVSCLPTICFIRFRNRPQLTFCSDCDGHCLFAAVYCLLCLLDVLSSMASSSFFLGQLQLSL